MYFVVLKFFSLVLIPTSFMGASIDSKQYPDILISGLCLVALTLCNPWTAAFQVPPDPGIKPWFLSLQVDSLPAELPGEPDTLIAAATGAKSLQSCLTLCDPIDGSPPDSPSLRFSRQEHWHGLPFPSPMCESEK